MIKIYDEPNISRIKGNKAMKFDQLTEEYNKIKIFLQTSCRK